ncbi:MAG: peptide chain release factor N(5)-glutamine methyltransferase [Pseudomonadota bacterium]
MDDPRSQPKSLTAHDLYTDAVKALRDEGFETPELDTNILLEHLAGVSALVRLTDPMTPINFARVNAFNAALARRLKGEPVHRIIGQREFYGIPFSISPDTLVPRPDSETLIDLAGPHVEEIARNTGHCRILDLGTGTGILALTLLTLSPDATAIGVDISEPALQVARKNARVLGLAGRFGTVQSNWFEDVSGKFDVIISNPPYIARHAIAGLARDVRDFDPHLALDGGVDGLNAYAVIASRAMGFLKANGMVVVEVGFDQAASVRAIFEAAGFRTQNIAKDFAGLDRAILFKP